MESKDRQILLALDKKNAAQSSEGGECFKGHSNRKNRSQNSALKQEPIWKEQVMVKFEETDVAPAIEMSKKLPKRGTRYFKMETVLQQAISAIAETTPVDQQIPTKRSRKHPKKSRINEDSSRQSKLREYDRRFREKRRQTETPEEAEARRYKAREAARIRRQQANKIALAQQFKGLLEQATGKQIAEQSSETANNEQNKIHQARLEKQKEDRRLKSREYNRLARQRQRECETPEQAAARRAKTAAAIKLRWQRAREALLAHIPALQIQKQTMDTTKSDENTGVQKAMRPGIPEVDQKNAAQILRQKATSIRSAKVNEQARKRKQKASEKELKITAKQNALTGATGASQRSWNKLAKYFLANASDIQTAAQETVTKAIACKQEFDANSLGCSTSTWSSECSFSIKTESESYPPAQQNPNEAVTVKNEYSQDAWSCYQGSESSFLTQDNTDFEPTTNLEGYPRANDAILPGNFHRAQTADFVPDEHSTYGAYIADRFYNANRNKSEDNVAQMLIESVMLNLLSGIYGYSINFVEADEVGQKEEAPSLPTQLTNKPTVNAVVVKEEVDL